MNNVQQLLAAGASGTDSSQACRRLIYRYVKQGKISNAVYSKSMADRDFISRIPEIDVISYISKKKSKAIGRIEAEFSLSQDFSSILLICEDALNRTELRMQFTQKVWQIESLLLFLGFQK